MDLLSLELQRYKEEIVVRSCCMMADGWVVDESFLWTRLGSRTHRLVRCLKTLCDYATREAAGRSYHMTVAAGNGCSKQQSFDCSRGMHSDPLDCHTDLLVFVYLQSWTA